jgi:hypothetical protein
MKIVIVLTLLAYLFTGCGSPKSKNISSQPDSIIESDTTDYHIGDTIYPFQRYDFGKGDWKAEILVSKDDDMQMPKGVSSKKKLMTSNIEVLKRIKDWKFKYTGGDIATISSTLRIVAENREIISFAIIIEKDYVGLQSTKYGWITSIDNSVIETIKLFD